MRYLLLCAALLLLPACSLVDALDAPRGVECSPHNEDPPVPDCQEPPRDDDRNDG